MDALTAGSPRQLEERPPGDGAAQKNCAELVGRKRVPHASHAILAGKIINLIVIGQERDALVRPLVRCNMNWFDS